MAPLTAPAFVPHTGPSLPKAVNLVLDEKTTNGCSSDRSRVGTRLVLIRGSDTGVVAAVSTFHRPSRNEVVNDPGVDEKTTETCLGRNKTPVGLQLDAARGDAWNSVAPRVRPHWLAETADQIIKETKGLR